MDKKSKLLSKNQKIVLDFIQKNKKPVKAYSILSNVQKKGINAPPQVYRALDKLIEIGKIHRVESQNSFVACKISNCDTPHKTIFSICNSCEIVSEINDPKLFKNLKDFISLNFRYENDFDKRSITISTNQENIINEF